MSSTFSDNLSTIRIESFNIPRCGVPLGEASDGNRLRNDPFWLTSVVFNDRNGSFGDSFQLTGFGGLSGFGPLGLTGGDVTSPLVTSVVSLMESIPVSNVVQFCILKLEVEVCLGL